MEGPGLGVPAVVAERAAEAARVLKVGAVEEQAPGVPVEALEAAGEAVARV